MDYETIEKINLSCTTTNMSTYEYGNIEITKAILYIVDYENKIISNMIDAVKWDQIVNEPEPISKLASGNTLAFSRCEYSKLMDGYNLNEFDFTLNAIHPDYSSHDKELRYYESSNQLSIPNAEGWKGIYIENISAGKNFFKMASLSFEMATSYNCDVKIITEFVFTDGSRETEVDIIDYSKSPSDTSYHTEVIMYTGLDSGYSPSPQRNIWVLFESRSERRI